MYTVLGVKDKFMPSALFVCICVIKGTAFSGNAWTTTGSETTHPQQDDQHYVIADLSLVYFKVTVSLTFFSTCLGVAQGKHKSVQICIYTLNIVYIE